ncbi:RNA polymerase sigma-70 factor [Pseudoflavitalea sp. G-6-1-2]|uniref:RNA polymerase sigma-70 factor n=1 Tax=Pseudoflavitalea sp. G-6-1-2 TaxID=2728841 RepID=UPI00146BC124|nr:RNA polymerase sigma-70 factor [Pseudoflavitalea sp. G-6-1-2]NML21344.1 RNA polymerase sigma-70 factor [Pseudoflavitalea sp. G-6-1-2]
MSTLSIYEQQELFKKIAAGDIAAFRQLFDLYRLRLFAAALKITKSGYAAEEIVQEIFTALWESRSNLENVENPPAYIFTVAYNKTFRFLKKTAGDNARLQALMKRAEDRDNHTEEWIDVRESQQILEFAIRQLPTKRQLIYRLSREEGLSYEQIAERLHLSKLTVKKQMALALQNLRSIVSKHSPLIALFLF